MSEVLRLETVAKTYNPGTPAAVTVLEGASLTLEAGEVVALVAPSGAGKSTLLHIAGLLDTPTAGRVQLLGQAVEAAPDATRTRLRRDSVGFVYQFHHLLPEFSALENVVLPQRAAGVGRGEAAARARELLDSVGLGHRLGHRPAELSGGEQQRVAFARALANRPRLLLADEPTGNLDQDTGERVYEVMRSIVRECGVTCMMVTHDHELAMRADAIVPFRDGRLATERVPAPRESGITLGSGHGSEARTEQRVGNWK